MHIAYVATDFLSGHEVAVRQLVRMQQMAG